MLDLVCRAYRQRLALEWRSAVLVATLAIAVPVVGLTQLIEPTWLLGGVGALIVLIVLGLLALAYVRPVSLPAIPGRFRDCDVSAAMALVRRGKPVEPAELQAAAVGYARRELRLAHLSLGWLPVVGTGWVLSRFGEPGPDGALGYVGVAFVLLGIGGLVMSGVVQGRLDRLEDAGDAPSLPAAATSAEEADQERP